MSEININDYKGVWVYAEQRQGVLQNVAIELVGEGRKIANELGVELSVIVLGSGVDKIAEELTHYGVDKVIYADHPLLEIYTTDGYAKVIANLIQERKPEIMLIGATTLGRDLGPRLSARVNTGLTADCTKLDIDPETRGILQTRPAFGGNLMATIICPKNRPQMSTVRPGVMEKAKRTENATGTIEKFTPELKEEEIQAKVTEVVKSDNPVVALEEAKIIVSGGRGLGNADGFKLIEQLAAKLGATVGSSRGAVDKGWISQAHQVGQTGKTVRPDVYIACGISGAIQHLAGMQESKMIIAINKDKGAPIFGVCDYGIVGDLYDVIPELISALDNVDNIVDALKK